MKARSMLILTLFFLIGDSSSSAPWSNEGRDPSKIDQSTFRSEILRAAKLLEVGDFNPISGASGFEIIIGSPRDQFYLSAERKNDRVNIKGKSLFITKEGNTTTNFSISDARSFNSPKTFQAIEAILHWKPVETGSAQKSAHDAPILYFAKFDDNGKFSSLYCLSNDWSNDIRNIQELLREISSLKRSSDELEGFFGN